MKDEVTIIGIIKERDFDSRVSLKDVKKIIYECLQLGPMWDPLMSILQKGGNIQNDKIEFRHINAALKSTSFLESTPLFLNSRETYQNIKLISNSIIIWSKGLMKLDEIRQGVLAYTLIARESKAEFLSLNVEKIMRAFRLVNRAVSEVVLKKWYENCSFYLDCNQEDRIIVEKEYKERPYDAPFLLPHEFLYLLCNGENRLEAIERSHNPELVSQKQKVNNWELPDRERGGHQVSHIHLLGQSAFQNQAPHVMLTHTLNRDTEDKMMRYIGVKPKGEVQTYGSPTKPSKKKQAPNSQYLEFKEELKQLKQNAVTTLGHAKKFIQRFQTPYLEIMQNANGDTLKKIAPKFHQSPEIHENYIQRDYQEANRQRPKTAKPMSREEIMDRNITFRNVSKINLKRAQQIQRESYKPPNKDMMKSKYSNIFSDYNNASSRGFLMQSKLQEMNLTKARHQFVSKNQTQQQFNVIMLEELEKFEKVQQKLIAKSKKGKSKLAQSQSIEKILDYVQCFSKDTSTTAGNSVSKFRPQSSYRLKSKLNQSSNKSNKSKSFV